MAHWSISHRGFHFWQPAVLRWCLESYLWSSLFANAFYISNMRRQVVVHHFIIPFLFHAGSWQLVLFGFTQGSLRYGTGFGLQNVTILYLNQKNVIVPNDLPTVTGTPNPDRHVFSRISTRDDVLSVQLLHLELQTNPGASVVYQLHLDCEKRPDVTPLASSLSFHLLAGIPIMACNHPESLFYSWYNLPYRYIVYNYNSPL